MTALSIVTIVVLGIVDLIYLLAGFMADVDPIDCAPPIIACTLGIITISLWL